jgi:nitrogen regulatory protein PII
MVLAIIRPDRLQQVKEALAGIGVSGMMVTKGQGSGSQEGYQERFRGFEYRNGMLAKLRVEIAVLDSQSDEVVRAISDAAYTGEIGDGKIFVSSLEESIRVRTGESGEASVGPDRAACLHRILDSGRH